MFRNAMVAFAGRSTVNVLAPITGRRSSERCCMHSKRIHPMSRPKGLFVLGAQDYGLIYGSDERAEIDRLVDLYAPPQTSQSIERHPEILADVEVIISGWGMCRVERAFLDAAPK